MQDSRLNIFIYPMLSVDNINGDSNYIIFKQVVNAILSKTNKFNFILLLDSERAYQKDDIDKRVKIIKTKMATSKKHQVTEFNTRLFKQIFQRFPIDIIWNNVVEQGHNFKYFTDTISDDYKFKVFNHHHYVIHKSLGGQGRYDILKNILFNQLVGSLGADLNYFQTQHCFNMLLEEAEKYLSKSSILQIKNNSVMKLAGYCEENVIESSEKYEKFTFIYNHRLDGYKNYKDTFQQFDKLYAQGFDFQVILTAADSANTNSMNKRPYAKIKNFVKHSDYLKELSKCHANATNSQHETYCISIAESIMNDQIIFAPNDCTFPELLGKDYPFLFNSLDEQYKKMKKVLESNVRSYNNKNKKALSIDSHSDFLIETFSKLGQIKPVFSRIKNQDKKKAIEKKLKQAKSVKTKEMRSFLSKIGLSTQSFPEMKVKKLMSEFDLIFDLSSETYKRFGK